MLVETIVTPGAAHGAAIHNGFAYIGDYSDGVAIYDIVNPSEPIAYPSIPLTSVVWAVSIYDDNLFVGNSANGLKVYSLEIPEAPGLIGWYDLPSGDAGRIVFEGTKIIVAEYDKMAVYEFIYQDSIPVVLYPNSQETISIFSTDTIRWTGVYNGGWVSIELNRHYPNGAWETITGSTENDGEYEWFVTDPLSDSCRVRICNLQNSYCDESNVNFSIMSLQGYLALAKTSQVNVPLTSWDPGVVECPQTESQWFRLKNFGNESIDVYQPLEPVTSEFSRASTCEEYFVLAPNQVSACSVRVVFDPASDGAIVTCSGFRRMR